MEEEKISKIKDIIEWIICIVIALVIAILFRYYIGTPTIVKQPSMFPTLKENQRLWLNRWGRTTNKMPEKGDIITFEAPTTTELSRAEMEENVLARYEKDPKGWWGKFTYYVLEINKTSYIKRVIGVAGDKILIENGKVYLNGEELQEDYLREGITTERTGVFYDFTVPEGYVFAMGDNRPQSMDCREFGCIPLEKVESKVLFRFWPFNKFGKV